MAPTYGESAPWSSRTSRRREPSRSGFRDTTTARNAARAGTATSGRRSSRLHAVSVCRRSQQDDPTEGRPVLGRLWKRGFEHSVAVVTPTHAGHNGRAGTKRIEAMVI